MERLEIIPATSLVSRHQVPGSKSYTNRAITIAAMAQGATTLHGALLSDDTFVAREALSHLGLQIEQDGTTFEVQGQHGEFVMPEKPLYLGNSGTATRFFTAMLTLPGFALTLTGNDRMQERPIGDLLDALNQLGASVKSVHDNDCPPVQIDAQRLRGGTTTISGAISSQFLSALLIAAPYAQTDVTLQVRDKLVSRPYVDLTLDIMRQFGVQVTHEDYRQFFIPGQQVYRGRTYLIEGDVSSATYFWGLAALLGQEMCVTNIPASSAQGDLAFVDVLEQMGCTVSRGDALTVTGPSELRPLGEIDLNALPDGAMTVAVLAAFCPGVTRIRNVWNLRVKETDRLQALANELRKIGVAVEELEDGLHIDGALTRLHGAEIATYDDHRMAMCFGMAGARLPGIRIQEPGCVTKTYPGFWDDLAAVGVRVQHV
ncbi:3-phosphoshikimate 1-carboxyvinyltransferase [Candidatus Entotheonella serta]|nr:3-phosphoshikimate 1-carboxyvinyltransferase [Candidatus Entotheonella serta]